MSVFCSDVMQPKDIKEVVPQGLELRVLPSRQQVVPPQLAAFVAVPGLSPLPHLGSDVLLEDAVRPLCAVLRAAVEVSAAGPHQRGCGAPGQRDALEHSEVRHGPVGRRHHHHPVLGEGVPGEAADVALAGMHASLNDGGLRLIPDGRRGVLHVVQTDDGAVARQRGQQAGTGGTPGHLETQRRQDGRQHTRGIPGSGDPGRDGPIIEG